MKLASALVYAALLTLGLATSAAAADAAPNKPEKLPADAQREVLGIWKLRSTDCTRAIERMAERFFIVARCLAPSPADGSIGIPLKRVTETSYINLSGVTYEIDAKGYLLVKVGSEVYDRGVPLKNLWPE